MGLFNTIRMGASGGGDYEVERSLRFNNDDSPRINRTPSSAGNRKTWTKSFWLKRGSISRQFITAYYISGTDVAAIEFTDTHVLSFYDYYNGYRLHLVTNRVFRDPSAWYHIVIALDTTQSTSSDRAKIYVNGEQVTSFSTETYPSQNLDVSFNQNVLEAWGTEGTNQRLHFDGYMSEITYIDGLQLTPSSFGETNATTGQWVPIDTSELTYGTNGYRLQFADNSGTSATTLGKDSSGNGNNFTPNNFSVSAGAGNDSVEDTPTKNFCTINPLDTYRSGNTLAEGNLKLTRSGSNFGNARGTFAVNSGKWYYEWKCTGQHTQVGWVNTGFNINYNSGDVAVTSSGGNGVGMYWDSRTFMYGWQNSGGNDYFPSSGSFVSYTTGDIIMVAFDVDNFKFWFGKNGSWINVLGTADPSSGTDGITPVASKNDGTYASGMYFSPLISCFSGGNGHVNFGQRPFSYTIPTGYKTLCTANLPDPTILLPNKHFDTLLWTGNGSNNHSITGLDFQPDWVWIKARTTGVAHYVVDALRKNGSDFKHFYTNSTVVEQDASTRFTSIDSGGFTLPSGGTFTNGNGYNYVAWNWNAGGSTVTNNTGSLSAQVRANPTAGFSILTYTGTNNVSETLGHGLGVKPDMIIVKSRNVAGQDWVVYNKNLDGGNQPATHILKLNGYAGEQDVNDVWQDTEPTSSVFTIGTEAMVNHQAGHLYVAYCFAGVEGYSKFGKYVGNGNADGTFVFTGFKPAFVITRGLHGTSWYIYDNKRNTGNVVNKELNSNNTQTEATFTTLDFLSNGFKIRSSNDAFNYNNYNYIYLAFAESPFKNSRAR